MEKLRGWYSRVRRSYEDAKSSDACDDNVLDTIGGLRSRVSLLNTVSKLYYWVCCAVRRSQKWKQLKLLPESSKKSISQKEHVFSQGGCKTLFHKVWKLKFIVTHRSEAVHSHTRSIECWTISGVPHSGCSSLVSSLRNTPIIQRAYPIVVDVVEAMDKAANAAGSIKKMLSTKIKKYSG